MNRSGLCNGIALCDARSGGRLKNQNVGLRLQFEKRCFTPLRTFPAFFFINDFVGTAIISDSKGTRASGWYTLPTVRDDPKGTPKSLSTFGRVSAFLA